MTFDVPLPPRYCSPNAPRGMHWSHKRDAVEQYRNECWVEAYKAIAHTCEPYPFTKAVINYTFYLRKTAGRYCPKDKDNAIGSMKACQDAMVLAKLFSADDAKKVSVGTVELTWPGKGKGFVRVTVEEKT